MIEGHTKVGYKSMKKTGHALEEEEPPTCTRETPILEASQSVYDQ